LRSRPGSTSRASTCAPRSTRRTVRPTGRACSASSPRRWSTNDQTRRPPSLRRRRPPWGRLRTTPRQTGGRSRSRHAAPGFASPTGSTTAR
jgi:hypothetical protein